MGYRVVARCLDLVSMGRPPTTLQEAEAVRNAILERHPEGVSLQRSTFNRLLVQGYRKSLDAAQRLTATGEVAGFWIRRRNPQARNGLDGWVEVLPLTVQPGSQRQVEAAMPMPA